MDTPHANGIRGDRVPASLAEVRALVAYNERILATSTSAQRRHRAERMLANLQPHLARFEPDARATIASPSASRVVRDRDLEYEVVWDGAVR